MRLFRACKRSSMKFNRCLLILADGARPDIFADLVAKGRLPNVQKHFKDNGTFEKMVTVFPSTTGPAYLPYITGKTPGQANVPGIRWFDKKRYAEKGWGFGSFRSYCGLEAGCFDKDMAQDVKTVWDVFENPKNILGGITKGLKRKDNLTRYSRIPIYFYSHQSHKWDATDRLAHKKVMKLLDSADFDFAFAVYPAIDEYAHLESPFADKTIGAYEQFDAYLGEIFAKLEEKGIAEETLVAIVSDHGHCEVKKHFDVGPWLQQEKDLKTFYYTNIFKFRFDAVSMVSGNGMAHLYFKGADGWGGRAFYEELSNQSLLLDELRLREEVDFIALQGRNGEVHVLSEFGRGAFSYDSNTKMFTYAYDKTDPLQVFDSGNGVMKHSFSLEESLKMTLDKKNPDIFFQLHQVFESPRTGDIIVSANPGCDLRDKFESPEHFSGHGALHKNHMLIPFLINTPLNVDGPIRSLDVLPTILNLMGKPPLPDVYGRILG